jgi:hypothetical protein
VATALSPLDEIRAQLQEAVSAPGLAPVERLTQLRLLRDRIKSLLGEADTYIGDVELLREAEYLEAATALLRVRENATLRDTLIARGMVTPEEMDGRGYLSHEALDHLREEGRLIESVEQILAFVDEREAEDLAEGVVAGFFGDLIHWDPDLHPRDRRGRFSKVLGKAADMGTAKLPSGVEVKKHKGGGFTVHHPDGSSSAYANPDDAAGDALHQHDRLRAAEKAEQMAKQAGKQKPTLPKGRTGKPLPQHLVSGNNAMDEDEDTGGELDDDVVRTSNVEEAVAALAEGKRVELEHIKQVSTLLDKLAEVARDMEQKGEKSPPFDLCKVTVKGTSLFCVESKGIPRILMPQLAGIPQPGSKAQDLVDAGELEAHPVYGGVDLTDHFVEHLTKNLGVKVERQREKAANLKASQRELDGSKVAGIMGAIREGNLSERPILVSQDDYIVDGHHTWAGTVGVDFRDGNADMDMPVMRADMPIIDLLAEAGHYANVMGIPPVSVPGANQDEFGRKMPEGLHESLKGMLNDDERTLGMSARQSITDPDELWNVAPAMLDSYRALLDLGAGISETLGATSSYVDSGEAFDAAKQLIGGSPEQAHVVIASLKNKETAAKKVAGQFGGEWGLMTDVVRGTVLVPHPADVPVVMDHVRTQGEKEGWKVSQVLNRMVKGDDDTSPGPVAAGYSDVKLLIEKDGFQAELQVNTPDMWRAKEIDEGHKLFEAERDILRAAGAEGRELTPEEESLIANYRLQARLLYLHAWEDSLSRPRLAAAA